MHFHYFYLIFIARLYLVTTLAVQRAPVNITPDQLLKIAPGSDSCPSSSEECATSSQAAPFLNEAVSRYQLASPAEQASVLALIAFESGNFKYNINHFPAPGRPGQGTRNMQSASFNLKYVKSIPELASQTAYTTTDGLSGDQLNEIRALVLPDKYAWASAAWFLTQIPECADARQLLQSGGNPDAGFLAHMRCVGVPDVDSQRRATWEAAKAALNV